MLPYRHTTPETFAVTKSGRRIFDLRTAVVTAHDVYCISILYIAYLAFTAYVTIAPFRYTGNFYCNHFKSKLYECDITNLEWSAKKRLVSYTSLSLGHQKPEWCTRNKLRFQHRHKSKSQNSRSLCHLFDKCSSLLKNCWDQDQLERILPQSTLSSIRLRTGPLGASPWHACSHQLYMYCRIQLIVDFIVT